MPKGCLWPTETITLLRKCTEAQKRIEQLQVPVWVCFGPDLKPRRAYLKQPYRAEGHAAQCDGINKQASRTVWVYMQEEALRLGYFVVQLSTRVPLIEFGKVGP
jgi:hypothetical protein